MKKLLFFSFFLLKYIFIKNKSYFCIRYLSLGNMGDATDFLDEITSQVEAKGLELPASDLMEFIEYLMEMYV